MEEIVNYISAKISSYNIFNNLFPGIIFCSVLTKATRFDFSTNNILEQLFIWYFTGIIISRIGSVFVEDALKRLKFKNKPYLVFAEYNQYIAASEAKPFIAILSETNNTYRTIIALLISVGVVYLYDIFIFNLFAEYFAIGNQLAVLIVGVLLIVLFVKSYKKQTDYVRQQVEKYVNDQNSSQ